MINSNFKVITGFTKTWKVYVVASHEHILPVSLMASDYWFQNMSGEMFTPCLVDLCKALWEVMKSYHKTMEWHDVHDKELAQEAGQFFKY